MQRGSIIFLWAGIALLAILLPGVGAQERFPTPEFESGYTFPVEQLPDPVAPWVQVLDVGLYALAIGLAGWFLLGRRRRSAVAILAVLAMLYFGFYRHGCICPVGSIGNVTRGLFLAGRPLAVVVLILFLLPLVGALLMGRVFCGGVCPLGIVQDIFLLRPLHLPRWLTEPLGMFRYVYLGLVVLAVYTTGRFLACRFDPFVGFFRMSGSAAMLITGGGILGLATVVGRPYCRFVCPYGALLGLAARFSWLRVRVSPTTCIKCGLCAEACPFGAIQMYPEPEPPPVVDPGRGRLRVGMGFLLLVLFLGGAGWFGGRLAGVHWAEASYSVSLVRETAAELTARGEPLILSNEQVPDTGLTIGEHLVDAEERIKRFTWAGSIFGLFLGLAFGLKFIQMYRRRPPTLVRVEGGRCFSCGRCYQSCPVHRQGEDRGDQC